MHHTTVWFCAMFGLDEDIKLLTVGEIITSDLVPCHDKSYFIIPLFFIGLVYEIFFLNIDLPSDLSFFHCLVFEPYH